jgi:drug/metabolite transporter (DMT)-like permease
MWQRELNMDEYLDLIEKHIKRSAYPIATILGGFLVERVSNGHWQLTGCALILILSGFFYLAVVGVNAVFQITAAVNRRWLKAVIGPIVGFIYLSIFSAGIASGISKLPAHNQLLQPTANASAE